MRNDVGLREGGLGWRDKTWLDSGCVLKVELVGSADKSRVHSDGKRRVENAATTGPLEGGSLQHLGGSEWRSTWAPCWACRSLWPETGCWKSRRRPLAIRGKRGLKSDTGLFGRWRVSAESVGPGAEGSLLAEVGGLARGPELALGWRMRSGEEPGAAKAKNWGKGHRKAAKTFKLGVVCVSYSVTSDSLRPRGLQPTRLLSLWNFPGRNTGMGCHSLL